MIKTSFTTNSCLCNRAACRFQLAEYEECIKDVNAALRLFHFTTKTKQTIDLESIEAKCILKGLVRRGTSFAILEQFQKGTAHRSRANFFNNFAALEDYEEAMFYDPNNESLNEDLDSIKSKIEDACK
jgi:hypothetical protein